MKMTNPRIINEWRIKELEAENKRLRARMAAVSDKLKRIADAVANGDFSGHSLLDERLLIGSRIDDVAYDDLAPTTEQQDDWPEDRVDAIGQNGNDGHHYEHAERESLPLMARRDHIDNAPKDGSPILTYCGLMGYQVTRWGERPTREDEIDDTITDWNDGYDPTVWDSSTPEWWMALPKDGALAPAAEAAGYSTGERRCVTTS